MIGPASASEFNKAGFNKLLVVRPEAEADVQSAYRWYEKQQAGLGEAFLESLDQAIHSIQRLPQQHPKVHLEVRRVLLRRFPYGVFYQNEQNRTVILAVMHQSRDPGRWKDRA